MCDIVFSVMWDVVEHDRPHGVGPLNPLLIRFRKMLASTLAESEDFICIGFVPNALYLGCRRSWPCSSVCPSRTGHAMNIGSVLSASLVSMMVLVGSSSSSIASASRK